MKEERTREEEKKNAETPEFSRRLANPGLYLALQTPIFNNGRVAVDVFSVIFICPVNAHNRHLPFCSCSLEWLLDQSPFIVCYLAGSHAVRNRLPGLPCP